MTFVYDPHNIFARLLKKEIPCQILAQNEGALAFHDKFPQAPFHVLVIPKGPYVNLRHFLEEASAKEQQEFWTLVKHVMQQGGIEQGRLVTNMGAQGGQEVPHFHVHVLAGRKLGAMAGPCNAQDDIGR